MLSGLAWAAGAMVPACHPGALPGIPLRALAASSPASSTRPTLTTANTGVSPASSMSRKCTQVTRRGPQPAPSPPPARPSETQGAAGTAQAWPLGPPVKWDCAWMGEVWLWWGGVARGGETVPRPRAGLTQGESPRERCAERPGRGAGQVPEPLLTQDYSHLAAPACTALPLGPGSWAGAAGALGKASVSPSAKWGAGLGHWGCEEPQSWEKGEGGLWVHRPEGRAQPPRGAEELPSSASWRCDLGG